MIYTGLSISFFLSFLFRKLRDVLNGQMKKMPETCLMTKQRKGRYRSDGILIYWLERNKQMHQIMEPRTTAHNQTLIVSLWCWIEWYPRKPALTWEHLLSQQKVEVNLFLQALSLVMWQKINVATAVFLILNLFQLSSRSLELKSLDLRVSGSKC